MSQKLQWGMFAVLLVVLILFWAGNLSSSGGITSVFTGSSRIDRFVVPNPSLRLDLLREIRKQEYAGMQRNIFKSTPLPRQVAAVDPPKPYVPVGPEPEPAKVETPLVLPFKFYGFVSDARGGRLRGFFTHGDDIIVAGEGETVAV